MWTDQYWTTHSVCTLKCLAFSLGLSKTQSFQLTSLFSRTHAHKHTHIAIVCLWLTAFFMTHLVMRTVGGPHDRIIPHPEELRWKAREKGGSECFTALMPSRGKKFHSLTDNSHEGFAYQTGDHRKNWNFKYKQSGATWNNPRHVTQRGRPGEKDGIQDHTCITHCAKIQSNLWWSVLNNIRWHDHDPLIDLRLQIKANGYDLLTRSKTRSETWNKSTA